MAQFQGLAEMRRSLSSLRTRLEQPEAFLREQVAPLLRETIKENVAVGGRPPFSPLAPATLAARQMDPRRRALPGTRPLAGGDLEAGYTQENHPHHVEEVRGNTLEFGSERGAIHERGGSRAYPIRAKNAPRLAYVGSRKRGGIGWTYPREVTHPPLPARPLLTLPEETWTRLEQAGEAYLKEEP